MEHLAKRATILKSKGASKFLFSLKEIDTVLKYMKTTKDIPLKFYKEMNVKEITITVLVNASYAHDKETKLSRTEILVIVNSFTCTLVQ